VRRVRDARYRDALFPVWRYHPFFTNSPEPVADADITHRRHVIIETVFADLIDGPLAHMPSGRFGATPPGSCARRSRTTCCAPPEHWPAAPTPSRAELPCRRIVNIAARLARPQRRPVLHLPSHWPWTQHVACTVAQHNRTADTTTGDPDLTTPPKGPDRNQQEKLGRPADSLRPPSSNTVETQSTCTVNHIHGLRLRAAENSLR
jgi:hypothetical protein